MYIIQKQDFSFSLILDPVGDSLWVLSGQIGEKMLFASLLQASLVAQTVKCLPTMWETWVQSLVWEAPLEKEMATHSSTLAWKIPWMEEPGGLQSVGSQSVGQD